MTMTTSRPMTIAVSSSGMRPTYVIVIGAICYQLFIAPVEGQPAAISKLNTAFQLAMLFFTLTNAAYAWPPSVSLLVLGAAVVFTSIVSGLTYVLKWSARAWRVARSAH
jgi:cardiolipin synthase